MNRITVDNKTIEKHLQSKLKNSKSIIDSILKESKGKKMYWPHRQRTTDLPFGWIRATFIVEEAKFKKLKRIAQIKGLDVKDIVNSLIDLYNRTAITSNDLSKVEEEKKNLITEIKGLSQIQTS
jgi:hypothetical protein